MGITKPSKAVFWIALILGLYAIVDQFFFNMKIPIIDSIPNMVMLTIAFILIMLSIIINKF